LFDSVNAIRNGPMCLACLVSHGLDPLIGPIWAALAYELRPHTVLPFLLALQKCEQVRLCLWITDLWNRILHSGTLLYVATVLVS
jgi:hypothetical protein